MIKKIIEQYEMNLGHDPYLQAKILEGLHQQTVQKKFFLPFLRLSLSSVLLLTLTLGFWQFGREKSAAQAAELLTQWNDIVSGDFLSAEEALHLTITSNVTTLYDIEKNMDFEFWTDGTRFTKQFQDTMGYHEIVAIPTENASVYTLYEFHAPSTSTNCETSPESTCEELTTTMDLTLFEATPEELFGFDFSVPNELINCLNESPCEDQSSAYQANLREDELNGVKVQVVQLTQEYLNLDSTNDLPKSETVEYWLDSSGLPIQVTRDLEFQDGTHFQSKESISAQVISVNEAPFDL